MIPGGRGSCRAGNPLHAPARQEPRPPRIAQLWLARPAFPRITQGHLDDEPIPRHGHRHLAAGIPAKPILTDAHPVRGPAMCHVDAHLRAGNRSRAGVWYIFRPIRPTWRRRAGRKHVPDPLKSGSGPPAGTGSQVSWPKLSRNTRGFNGLRCKPPPPSRGLRAAGPRPHRPGPRPRSADRPTRDRPGTRATTRALVRETPAAAAGHPVPGRGRRG